MSSFGAGSPTLVWKPAIRYKLRCLQIEPAPPDPSMLGSRITIERRLDGSLHFRRRERHLDLTEFVPVPVPVPVPVQVTPQAEDTEPTTRSPNKPAPDHPWRKQGTFHRTFLNQLDRGLF
jgi:hypothetical protein